LPGWIAKVAPSWNNLKPHPELAKEEISVIFVEHRDTSKIRKIFNKVNRYAKLTSRSDNIITSDDDIFAVIARKLIVEGEPLYLDNLRQGNRPPIAYVCGKKTGVWLDKDIDDSCRQKE
jgi:hypothetical protein